MRYEFSIITNYKKLENDVILRSKSKLISRGLISIMLTLGLAACNAGSGGSSTQNAPTINISSNSSVLTSSSSSLTPNVQGNVIAPTSANKAAASANNYAYIVNQGSNTVSMYSMDKNGNLMPMNSNSQTIPTGSSPMSITIDPSHHYAYVPNLLDSTISMYSIVGNSGLLSPLSESPVPTDKNPVSVTFGQNGEYAYAITGIGMIDKYSLNQTTGVLSDKSTINAINDMPQMMIVDENGEYAYTANGDDSITSYSIDAKNGQLNFKQKTPINNSKATAISITLSKSGKYAYELSDTPGQIGSVYIYAINQGALSYLSEFATGNSPTGLTLDPSGDYVYVTNANDNSVSVYNINADGNLNLESTVATDITAPSSIQFDPTGKYMYIMSSKNNQVGKYIVGKGTLVPLLPETLNLNKDCDNCYSAPTMLLSTSGKNAYFIDAFSQIISTYSINQNTGELSMLAKTKLPIHDEENDTVISPSGQYIYVLNYTSIEKCPINENTGELGKCVEENISFGPKNMAMGDNIAISSSGQYAYVAGNIQVNASVSNGVIWTYSIDQSTGELSQLESNVVPDTDNAYNITFSPSGQYAYMTGMASDLQAPLLFAYSVDTVSGKLTQIAQFPINSNIYFDPSGQYAYSYSRGNDNSILGYSVNQETGGLNQLAWSTAVDSTDQHIIFDPSGQYAYAYNYSSDNSFSIQTFSKGDTTGQLNQLAGSIVINGTTVAGLDPLSISPSSQYAYVTYSNSDGYWMVSVYRNAQSFEVPQQTVSSGLVSPVAMAFTNN